MTPFAFPILVLALAAPAAAAPAAAAPAFAAAAEERTPIERRLAEQDLCAGLQTEQFGQTIGLSEVEDVTLREADLSLRGEEVSLSFAGRLACRSPEDGLLPGDASAAVTLRARLSLADCRPGLLEIALDDFQGSFGPLLGTFSPQIEQALAAEAETLLVRACRDFVGRD